MTTVVSTIPEPFMEVLRGIVAPAAQPVRRAAREADRARTHAVMLAVREDYSGYTDGINAIADVTDVDSIDHAGGCECDDCDPRHPDLCRCDDCLSNRSHPRDCRCDSCDEGHCSDCRCDSCADDTYNHPDDCHCDSC